MPYLCPTFFEKNDFVHSEGDGAAAYIQSEDRNSGQNGLNYLATDLLGSITAIVPAGNGTIEYRSYDAWGRQRNPDDWTYNNVSAFSLIDRGYTFHEHLPEFGLINMNGRMYDPLVARFLSPDPYVQDPGSTQGFNRYSYCLNNPLKYNDPDGEFWQFVVVFVVSAAVDYISQVIENYGNEELSPNDIWWGEINFARVGISGLSTVLSAAIPVAAPFIPYIAAPISNAIELTPNRGFKSVFNNGIEWKDWAIRSVADAATMYISNIWAKGLRKNTSKELSPILTPSKDINWGALGREAATGFSSKVSSDIIFEGIQSGPLYDQPDPVPDININDNPDIPKNMRQKRQIYEQEENEYVKRHKLLYQYLKI